MTIEIVPRARTLAALYKGIRKIGGKQSNISLLLDIYENKDKSSIKIVKVEFLNILPWEKKLKY